MSSGASVADYRYTYDRIDEALRKADLEAHIPEALGEGYRFDRAAVLEVEGADAQGNAPHIIITAPPPILDNLMETRHAECFGEQAIAVSKGLGPELHRVSKLLRVDFFDAAPYAEVSALDAVHMTANGHLRLAEVMADKIRTLL